MQLDGIRELAARGEYEAAILAVDGLGDEDRIEGTILKSRALLANGNVQDAMSVARYAVTSSQDAHEKGMEVNALAALAYTLQTAGQSDEALATVGEAEFSLLMLSPEERERSCDAHAVFFTVKGCIAHSDGDLRQALINHEKALAVAEHITCKPHSAVAHNNVGTVLHAKGQLDGASEHFEQAIEIQEQLGNNNAISETLTSLGDVYRSKGEPDEAIVCYNKALTHGDILGNGEKRAAVLVRMAAANHDNNELDMALTLLEEALDLLRIANNSEGVSEALFKLVVVSTHQKQAKLAQQFCEQYKGSLRDLPVNEDRKHDENTVTLSKALALKSTDKEEDRNKARTLLRELIETQDMDAWGKKKPTLAIKHLAEILAKDMSNEENEEVLQTVVQLFGRLREIGLRRNSYSLIVESLVLRSKASLIAGSIKAANSLLFQAYLTAEESGLASLCRQVSEEQSSLEKETDSWIDMISKGVPLKDRVCKSGMIEYLQSKQKDLTL